jgi:hypothetical protein
MVTQKLAQLSEEEQGEIELAQRARILRSARETICVLMSLDSEQPVCHQGQIPWDAYHEAHQYIIFEMHLQTWVLQPLKPIGS